MKSFRNVVFWCHLLVGLTAGVVILIMSVTGALLTYEKQVVAWANARVHRVAPPAGGAGQPSVEAALRGVMAREEGVPSALTIRSNPAAPWEVSYGRERTLFVNPHTGAVMGEGAIRVRGFFRSVTNWHRWLAATGKRRSIGKAVTGAANLGFLFLVVSGFYLWWPRNRSRSAVRNVTLFRRGLSGKARDFNWHNVLGFWSCVPLFLVVLSGVVISYPWASRLVFHAVGETPPARRGPPGGADRPGRRANARSMTLEGLDRAWARVEQQTPDWRIISLRLPPSPDGALAFTVDRGNGGQPQLRDRRVVNRLSGETVEWAPYAGGTKGQKARSFLRFAHTGEVAGVVGQTVAGLASAAAAVLVWTGFALTWRRFASWRVRKARRAGNGAMEAMAEEARGLTSGSAR